MPRHVSEPWVQGNPTGPRLAGLGELVMVLARHRLTGERPGRYDVDGAAGLYQSGSGWFGQTAAPHSLLCALDRMLLNGARNCASGVPATPQQGEPTKGRKGREAAGMA